jgi:hypothetical protein
MFLATSTAGAATPAFYLVSGDYAVFVFDSQTVQAFKKVGVPVVSFSPADLTALTTALKPRVITYSDSTLDIIDGGSPNSVLYRDDFDGGIATDITVVTTRTNFVNNPNMAQDNFGWGWFNSISSYVSTGGVDGGGYQHLTPVAAGTLTFGAFISRQPVPLAGVPYTASMWVRCSQSYPLIVSIECYNSAGTRLATLSGNPLILNPNTWVRVWMTGTVPAGTVSLTPTAYATSTSWVLGDSLDVDQGMIEAGVGLGSYFDGSTPDTDTVTYSWTGTPNGSPSIASLNPTDDGPVVDGNHS